MVDQNLVNRPYVGEFYGTTVKAHLKKFSWFCLVFNDYTSYDY